MSFDHLDSSRESCRCTREDARTLHDELQGRLELIDGILAWTKEELGHVMVAQLRSAAPAAQRTLDTELSSAKRAFQR